MANHTHQKMNEALQRKNNLKSNQSSTYRDSLSRGYKAKTYIKKKKILHLPHCGEKHKWRKLTNSRVLKH